ncbi:energy transducer TonB [Rubrivivax rivuli]|uniref:Energy transducer TonB n=1 Tax=Rubrivivax rivuli TaxID=1862385 RepID=A0A437REG1_9BURK|nr:energy transducer TonB [Rubrivivax rivuli]RVU45104.1 energy transducer TonB [Rubrivivax rivuli]
MPRPAQDSAASRPQHGRRPKGRGQLLAAVLGLLFLGGLAWLIVSVVGAPEGPRKPAVQQVAILRQPPPPPPPKPPERQPEPPKVKEEVKINEPKPEPVPDKPADPAPAAKPLGLDADGSAGSDGFGLAANKGGRDITTIGSAGGGGGGSGRYFTGLLQRNFFETLARNRRAPLDEFSVVVRVWIGDDGRVQRARIVEGSGNAELDQLIETTLSEMSPLREVPPVNLRQVQLRLNRRA